MTDTSPPHQCAESAASYLADQQAQSHLQEIHWRMAQLERQHPQWFAEMDLLDHHTSSVQELLWALSSAPDPFLKGMLYGVLTLRMAWEPVQALHR